MRSSVSIAFNVFVIIVLLHHVVSSISALALGTHRVASRNAALGASNRFSSTSTSLRASNNDDSYSIGLALSGGGTRASSTCIGFLRGFQQKKIEKKDGTTCCAMDLVKYNSGISGGSVPTLQYSFAQVPTDELLETDRTVNPEEITSSLLDELPKNSMGYTYTINPLRLPQIERIPFVLRRLNKVHSYWSAIVNRGYCRPLGIPRNKFFAANEEDVENILKENGRLKRGDFIVPRPDTKTIPMFLISLRGTRADFGSFLEKAGNAIEEAWDEYVTDGMSSFFTKTTTNRPPNSLTEKLLKSRDNHDGCLPVPYTVTTSAVRTMYEGTMKLGRTTTEFPQADVVPHKWGTRTRFSIETALAMSTNFLGLNEGIVGSLLTNVRKIDGVVKAIADGGLSDITGAIPLIQHDVKKCVVIYNFNQNPPYANFTTTYSEMYNAGPCTSLKDANFDDHFRQWLKYINPRITCYFGYFGGKRVDSTVLNHIFRDPKLDRLKELMIKYNSLYKAGEPLIATLRGLETIDNPFWGIEAGNKIDMTFIYLNMPKKFSTKVPLEAVPPPEGMDKIDENGQFTNEEMSQIPELPWNVPAEGLKYSNRQINMNSYLCSWMVHQAWKPLKGHDDRVKFEGFKEIFNPEKVAEL